MKSLIIGMGIGQLYKSVLSAMGHEVVTVDTNPAVGADFVNVEHAMRKYSIFDTVHICTPNFTHRQIAESVSANCNIIFVEKPGFGTEKEWHDFVSLRPFNKIMMVKNNMWRNSVPHLQDLAIKAKRVNIEWTRRNCIPSPGSWFTNKELAFGGVSRDLMPHLLSLYIGINPAWRTDSVNDQSAEQIWQLKDIESTDYGTVNSAGVYNVDDKCSISFSDKWLCRANWRSMDYENSAIEFSMPDNSVERFDLGWCPEEAYTNMITQALNNLNNNEFWKQQTEMDLWIHRQIENI